jgi:hypothetical protein
LAVRVSDSDFTVLFLCVDLYKYKQVYNINQNYLKI